MLTLQSAPPHLGEIHEAGAEALDLLHGGDGAEGYLPEALLVEGAVSDAAEHGPAVPDDGHAPVAPV